MCSTSCNIFKQNQVLKQGREFSHPKKGYNYYPFINFINKLHLVVITQHSKVNNLLL